MPLGIVNPGLTLASTRVHPYMISVGSSLVDSMTVFLPMMLSDRSVVPQLLKARPYERNANREAAAMVYVRLVTGVSIGE